MIYDFAIIGAGMAGASLAAELAPHGSVLVLEAESMPGYHATGRSAAFWDECYGGPDIVPLTIASGPFLRDAGFLNKRGALHIARADQAGQLAAFEQEFADTAATIERVNRASMEARIPGLHDTWTQAVFEPECCDIDVAGLHAYYLKAMRQHGAQLVTDFRLARAEKAEGIWQISDERGRSHQSHTLINAAGAWADRVAQIAGIRAVGITPYRRTVVQLQVEPGVPADMPLVLGIDGSFYFKPDAGSLWLSPHDETPSPPCDAAAEELAVAEAIERLREVVDWDIQRVEHKWAGLRSFAPDRRPVYGHDPEDNQFFWFAGQGGFGIQTAPAAARLGAQLVLGNGPDAVTQNLHSALYHPARF